MEKYAIRLPKNLQFTDDEFFDFCQENSNVQFERSARGEIIIVSPTRGLTKKKNGKISAKLDYWNEQYELGEVFNSSTGFTLPNGAVRSSDAAWVEKLR